MNEFFGLGYMNFFILIGVLGVIFWYAWGETDIFSKFRKFKPEIGNAYFHFRGSNGIGYTNAKVKDYEKNSFGTYTFRLAQGITLTNVNIDQRSDDCNALIAETTNTFGGVVDIYCNKDAQNNDCEWDKLFKENWDKIREDAFKDAQFDVKKKLMETKEFKETYNAESTSMNLPDYSAYKRD